MNVKPVRTKDQIPFTCRRCGNCCRHLKDGLMVEPLDAYYLGKHLCEQDTSMVGTEDIFARFTHATMLDGIYPIFLMNTYGADDACVFLQDGRCRVYEARPRACRLYPFTADVGTRGRRFVFYQGIDQNAAHFSGQKIKVGDWMYQNFTREARESLEEERAVLPDLVRLLQMLGKDGQRRVLFKVLFYRYYNYDLEKPFLTQYQKNHQDLLTALQEELNQEG